MGATWTASVGGVGAMVLAASPCAGQFASVEGVPELMMLEGSGRPPSSVAGQPYPARPAKPAKTAPPAEAEEIEEGSTKRWSLSVGADFTNAYYFRGIRQEDSGLIAQPWAILEFDALEVDEWGVAVDVGTWHSFQTQRTGTESGQGDGDFKRSWYEADGFAGVTLKWGEAAVRAAFNTYTSPSGAWPTSTEVAITVSLDDERWLEAMAVHPTVTLAIETGRDGADGGERRGVFLEVGITPGLDLPGDETRPWRLEFPVLAGFGLHEYYENEAGAEQGFGYFECGARLMMSLPLSESMGLWTVTAGVRLLWLGDGARELNEGRDRFEVIGVVGVSVEF